MIKKTISYTNFNGEDVTEDFYFNMTTAELAEKELVYPGGFSEHLQTIVKANDRAAIIAAFKDLILSSVGVKTEDGRGFVKKGVAEAFETTEAFSALFMELVTDAAKSAEFFNGVMPAKLAEKAKLASRILEAPEEQQEKERKFPDDYTKAELEAMPADQLELLISKIPGNNIPREVLLIAMRKSAR